MREARQSVWSMARKAVVAAAGLSMLIGPGQAGALPDTTSPQLSLDRLITTSPFSGSTTSVRDNEGSAYVPADDSLWIVDDNGDAAYEIDRTTGALKRTVAQTAFANAPQFGGGPAAGTARNEDLEALAYDATADMLYAFSGSTSATPTAYRLVRSSGALQVESWQPMASEHTAAGWRLADGLLYIGQSSSIQTYDYVTNALGSQFSITGLSNILGLDFDDGSGDLVAVNSSERLLRASMTTRAVLSGWTLDLTGFGVADSRGVEVIGEQVFVSDGLDTRAASDPMNHAVFVIDVSGPGVSAPRASFTATPTSGDAPLPVTFTDTSSGSPTSWTWNFGDGGTSTVQSPSHTYAAPGTYVATLTVTNAQGTDTATTSITVGSSSVVLASADAYTSVTRPAKNYGGTTELRLNTTATNTFRSYIKFDVNTLAAPPQTVKLRVYVTNASNRGGDWYSVSNSWTETGISWNNAPVISGSPVAVLGTVTIGQWVEIDVTSLVSANGSYSFAALSPSTDTVRFSTREGVNPPRLIITP